MYLALCTPSGNLVSGVYNAWYTKSVNTVLVENQHILCHLGRSPATSTSIREGSIHNIYTYIYIPIISYIRMSLLKH